MKNEHLARPSPNRRQLQIIFVVYKSRSTESFVILFLRQRRCAVSSLHQFRMTAAMVTSIPKSPYEVECASFFNAASPRLNASRDWSLCFSWSGWCIIIMSGKFRAGNGIVAGHYLVPHPPEKDISDVHSVCRAHAVQPPMAKYYSQIRMKDLRSLP